MTAEKFLTERKLLWVERFSYLLVLAPTLTDYIENGHLPGWNPLEWTTELALGLIILGFALYVRATRQSIGRLEELRAELSASIVHDLKNPLSAITGALDVLENANPSPSERAAVMTMAKTGCSAQLRLIEMLLETARLEEGSLAPALERFPVRELFAEVVAGMRGAAALKKILLQPCEIAPSVTVSADRALLRRVLENLVSNSIKYTPEGGTVSLDAMPLSQAGREQFIFAVSDTGSGVPREAADKLFRKYYRVEGRSQKYARGSGIGLYFCRLAVEAHGGIIAAQPRSGGGSSFAFVLPQPE